MSQQLQYYICNKHYIAILEQATQLDKQLTKLTQSIRNPEEPNCIKLPYNSKSTKVSKLQQILST